MNQYSEYLQRKPNLSLSRILERIAWVITVVVIGLVGVMRRVKIDLPGDMDLGFLPPVHALLNSCVAVLLILALVFIKKRRIDLHKRAISGAMICSVLFLLCYVAYHFTTEETSFGGTGAIRYAYYFLLVSHIVLAAVSFPGILLTWIWGYTNQFQRHRQWSKLVYPVWLYVAVTGPICYLMLKPYY